MANYEESEDDFEGEGRPFYETGRNVRQSYNSNSKGVGLMATNRRSVSNEEEIFDIGNHEYPRDLRGLRLGLKEI